MSHERFTDELEEDDFFPRDEILYGRRRSERSIEDVPPRSNSEYVEPQDEINPKTGKPIGVKVSKKKYEKWQERLDKASLAVRKGIRGRGSLVFPNGTARAATEDNARALGELTREEVKYFGGPR